MFDVDAKFAVTVSRLDLTGKISDTKYTLKPGDTFRVKRVFSDSLMVDQLPHIYEDCVIKDLDLLKACVEPIVKGQQQ